MVHRLIANGGDGDMLETHLVSSKRDRVKNMGYIPWNMHELFVVCYDEVNLHDMDQINLYHTTIYPYP